MWGPLLVLALLTTINPVRLGIVLLVLSRSRPMQSLLAYWSGALIIGLVTLLIPLFVLHANPTSASLLDDFADPTANPTAQRIAIGIGVVLVVIAALVAVRSRVATPSRGGRHSTRRLQGNTSTATQVLDSTAPPVITRLLEPDQDAATEGRPTIRRLLSRARNAWQNGSPWISFVIGVIIVPPLDGVLFGLAIILASGASIEIQFVGVIAFMLGVLLIEETILVSNLVAPAKTQAVLRRLHGWARAHQQKFVAAILTVVGASLMIRGMGGL
jgi:hypothetical protein